MADDGKINGFGGAENDLTATDFAEILEKSLAQVAERSRVLAIIPDKTRDDNTHQLFLIAAQILARKNIAKFDALVAQGTHAPMTEAEKLTKIGAKNRAAIPSLGNVFDHEWNNPQALISLGELSSSEVKKLTDGIIETPINLTVNRLVSTAFYDYVLIFGATVPHEVAGFAGGAKYFFPGVSGAELTHATHWLGALNGIENTVGRIETPTRNLIEAAADRIKPEIVCFTSVVARDVQNELKTRALFGGDFRLSLRKAATISQKVHVKYTGRKFKKVVAILDEHYDELWTGGKASYKLGGIVETGGELLIYAPHLRCVSDTHGAAIEKFGYAPIERIKELVAVSSELQTNLCVAAHLAHVAYAGRFGAEAKLPRYKITLASQISEEICRKINLNFLDYKAFSRAEYENDEDALIVERAGRDLYLVEPF